MEHRWGGRKPMGTKVRLVAWPGAIGAGTLRDVSLSGAFVETDLSLPLLARVAVDPQFDRRASGETQGIHAFVVRQEADGLGMEWCEFAPEAVLEWVRGTPVPHVSTLKHAAN